MRALSLVLGIALTCAGSVRAQSPDPNRAARAEFPAYEYSVLYAHERGLRLAAAADALARDPDSVETLSLLLAADRIENAIALAKRLVAGPADRLLPALTVIAQHNSKFSNKTRSDAGTLAQLAQHARQRLPGLPREDAARAARQILMFEPRQPSRPGLNAYEESLAEFMRDYAGTEEALLAEVDRMVRTRPSYQQVEALQAFARAHAGTAPGAKALYTAAHQLSVNVAINGVERRGSDPTDRFMHVLAIVKELESGAYGRNEWVARGVETVAGFFASNPVIAPANVQRLEAEYVAFATSHRDPDDPDPAESRVAYLIGAKLADLHKTQGDPVPRVEQTLDRLAEETGRSEYAFIKINLYLRTAVNEPARRTAMRAKALDALRTLSERGGDLYHRKALATLASLELEDGDFRSALEHFSRYLQKYPSSPYAWLASLRVGTAQAGLKDWRAAAAAYRAAANRYRAVPTARMLGHEYAARALEAVDDFTGALREHEAALNGWDPAYAGHSGRELTLEPRTNPLAPRPVSFEPAMSVSRDALTARVAELRRSLAHPSGTLFERGRWLFLQERRGEAVETWARLLKQSPRSPFAADARRLSHHAQLELALIAANVEGPSSDPAAAMIQLTDLIREPHDEAVCVAGIAHATLLARDRLDAARTAMRTALARCRIDGLGNARAARSPFDADVIAIRNTVFRPFGGPPYDKHAWSVYRWPATPPDAFLVSAVVTVKTPDGDPTQAVVREPIPSVDNVVFFSSDQFHLLNGVMTALGGTKRFAPASVMAVPNQPAGAALDVLGFWKEFFPAMPGHWGGWEFAAFPRIDAIEFLDASRTRAAVPVTIGYTGATVVLEKRNGAWQVVELTNFWIT